MRTDMFQVIIERPPQRARARTLTAQEVRRLRLRGT